LNSKETIKEINIKEDKYIFYKIEPANKEANDPNKREKQA
jgi:hypothetical protein